jgi:hypothetical protein
MAANIAFAQSYAVAQLDAVPPYWETTIVTSSASTANGEIIIDNLPTGSMFSFMWNLLVSMSFQFVGFLLTYIMHTTHAAKFGSRAGFGITLVQYGFYLRSKGATYDDEDVGYGGTTLSSYNSTTNRVISTPTYNSTLSSTGGNGDAVDSPMAAYFSFLLMTMGWFILISSALGYWRVKRLEAGIRSSAYSPLPQPRTAEEIEHDRQLLQNIENAFGIGLQLSPRELEEALESPERPRRRTLWGW